MATLDPDHLDVGDRAPAVVGTVGIRGGRGVHHDGYVVPDRPVAKCLERYAARRRALRCLGNRCPRETQQLLVPIEFAYFLARTPKVVDTSFANAAGVSSDLYFHHRFDHRCCSAPGKKVSTMTTRSTATPRSAEPPGEVVGGNTPGRPTQYRDRSVEIGRRFVQQERFERLAQPSNRREQVTGRRVRRSESRVPARRRGVRR